MNKIVIILSSTLLLLALAGCEDLGDKVQPPPSAPTPATISYAAQIQPIFNDNCTGCHNTGLASYHGNLNLQSYATLTDTEEPDAPLHAEILVIPGEPESSFLIQRITGEIPPQMPLGGTPLSEDQINLIRDWIEQGVLNN